MKRVWICLLSLALTFVSAAVAQTYTPLQQGHWGNWHDPSAVGEGIEIAVHDNAQRSISGEAFLLGDNGPVWFGLAGDWDTAWRPECGDYELTVFQRSAPNTAGFAVGSAWIQPSGTGQLRILMLANYDGEWLRSAMLSRAARPPGLPFVGVCNWSGSSFPRPPSAPDGWCHDDPPEYPAPTWCPFP